MNDLDYIVKLAYQRSYAEEVRRIRLASPSSPKVAMHSQAQALMPPMRPPIPTQTGPVTMGGVAKGLGIAAAGTAATIGLTYGVGRGMRKAFNVVDDWAGAGLRAARGANKSVVRDTVSELQGDISFERGRNLRAALAQM